MVDLIVLDFDVEKEAAGEPILDGTYEFQVSKIEEGVSKAGNRKLHIEADIINDPAYAGRRVFDDIGLTPQAAWKLLQFCKGVGVPAKNINLGELLGATFHADVENDSSFDGTPRPGITKYRAKA